MASGQNSHSKASLFLIELIISLFFFSLASVVCVRLFLYAHKVSTDSRRETLAVQISQNAAECFIAADGVEEEFLKLYDLTLSSGGGETGGKTGDAPQEEIRTSFTVREDTDAAGGTMCTLQIRNTAEDGTEVFSLEVLHFRRNPRNSGDSTDAPGKKVTQ